MGQVQQALQKTEGDPERLTLEITEGVLIDDFEDTTKKMKKLKDSGVSFAIDDFGTGYSSLSYLKRLPIDTIKIDKSFVADVPDDKNDSKIVETIIAMAKHLGLKVIAEGVETDEQVAFLSSLNCYEFQGYFFSPALDAKAFSNLLNSLMTN